MLFTVENLLSSFILTKDHQMFIMITSNINALRTLRDIPF